MNYDGKEKQVKSERRYTNILILTERRQDIGTEARGYQSTITHFLYLRCSSQFRKKTNESRRKNKSNLTESYTNILIPTERCNIQSDRGTGQQVGVTISY